jgi:hypothetical protein
MTAQFLTVITSSRWDGASRRRRRRRRRRSRSRRRRRRRRRRSRSRRRRGPATAAAVLFAIHYPTWFKQTACTTFTTRSAITGSGGGFPLPATSLVYLPSDPTGVAWGGTCRSACEHKHVHKHIHTVYNIHKHVRKHVHTLCIIRKHVHTVCNIRKHGCA